MIFDSTSGNIGWQRLFYPRNFSTCHCSQPTRFLNIQTWLAATSLPKKKKERNIRNWPKNFEQSRKFQPPAVISSWIFNTKLNDTNICPTNSFYMLNEIFSDDIRDIASRKWKKSGKTKGRIFFRRNQGNDMCTASFLDVRNRTPLDFSIGFVHYVFQSRFFLNKGQWK